MYKLGHKKKAMRFIGQIDDDAMKVDAIRFLKKLDVHFHELDTFLATLEKKLAFNLESIIKPVAQSSKNIASDLDSIPHEDLALLVKTFKSSSEPVDKETICKNVWNIDYDPTVHEYKVYKLIHKFRKYYKNKDIIINYYGRYQLNV